MWSRRSKKKKQNALEIRNENTAGDRQIDRETRDLSECWDQFVDIVYSVERWWLMELSLHSDQRIVQSIPQKEQKGLHMCQEPREREREPWGSVGMLGPIRRHYVFSRKMVINGVVSSSRSVMQFLSLSLSRSQNHIEKHHIVGDNSVCMQLGAAMSSLSPHFFPCG
jgi:hypothetical protein